MKKKNISIAILAGGKSKRFGEDKLKLKFRGKTFVENIVEKVSLLSDEIIVVGRKFKGAKECNDFFNIKASIIGIFSALKCAKNGYVLVLAGDLPLISTELLRYLISKISDDYDIIVPVVKGYYEPLVAIYSRRILKELFKMINSGDLKVSNIYKKFKILEIGDSELTIYDKELHSFFNVNNRDDYKYLKDNFE